jgi:hypothetical protein
MVVIISVLIISIIIYFAARKTSNVPHTKQLANHSAAMFREEKAILNPQNTSSLKVTPSSEKPEELINVTTEGEGNTTTFTVSLNEAEFIKRVNNGTMGKQSRSDEKTIEDIVGFYGSKKNQLTKNTVSLAGTAIILTVLGRMVKLL